MQSSSMTLIGDRFHVRAPTFYQKCRDQQLHISQLSAELEDAHNKLRAAQNMGKAACSSRSSSRHASTNGATGMPILPLCTELV